MNLFIYIDMCIMTHNCSEAFLHALVYEQFKLCTEGITSAVITFTFFC